MPLFGKTPKQTRRPNTTIDPEREKRKAESRRIKFATDEFIRQAQNDPDLKRQFVLDTFHITLPPKDPIAEQKNQIKKIITEEALKEIQNDPELRKEFARSQVEEIMGRKSRKHDDLGDFNGGGSPLEDILSELDNVELLKQRLGGGDQSLLGKLLTPENVGQFLGLITALQGGKLPMSKTYIVQLDGKQVEVTEEQYKQLSESGRLRPVAELAAPVSEVPDDEPEDIGGPPSEPEIPEGIDLTALFEMLDREPEEVIAQLQDEVNRNVEGSKATWDFFGSSSYESIVELVTPYKANKELVPIIDNVLSRREWFDRVIQLVKESNAVKESDDHRI